MKKSIKVEILVCDVCGEESREGNTRAGYDFCLDHLWVKSKVESLNIDLYKDLIPEIVERAKKSNE